MDLVARLVDLNAAYARAIDNEAFEEWPDFFLDDCLYKVTSTDNHARGYEAGVMYADSRDMLRDRVSALRQANIYERQRYRHIVGLPAVLSRDGGEARVETPFLVVRIMRSGEMDVFATGRYLDRVSLEDGQTLRFRERLVVCDGGRFDTLVALPL
ncbi:MAG TPA: aromatic-ring-hydroxylating dioxygenase subunit beta [Vineibacter sp.]|nr:aromatic-ring-hydroxylating dioxygenase subunit beta [Vineibacter sp.]